MLQSIRFKLFLTFLATTLLIVFGMYGFMHWSLSKGFSELIEVRQQERVDNLKDELSDYYSTHQSWENLANSKKDWLTLLLRANPRQRHPNWLDQALNTPNKFWPPNLTDQQAKRNFIPLELRIMLFDMDKQLVLGREDLIQNISLLPIEVAGESVGYLGLMPGKTVNNVSEIRFIEHQTDAFIWIAILMFFLSATLALLLAYFLGLPLKKITTAVKTLAKGNYNIRLASDSKDELGQLSRDFNDMAAALEQSELARRRWVADISHELRTPLAILQGELEALQDGIRPLDKAAVDSLLNETLRLNRLADDLYQLSLSDQGALSYRKTVINPVEILREDLEGMKGMFKNKRITVNWKNLLTQPIAIYADSDRLSQLFRNLLNNSVNYTNEQGLLEITLQRNTDNLVIEFSDSAPGVPESELPKLFDRFYRLSSSRNSHRNGAGLGLAIGNNIVQAHNGKIAASISAMQGLAIHLEFPIYS